MASGRLRRLSTIADRSPMEWGVRGVLAVLAAAVGTASVAATLGSVLKTTNPVRAHVLAPWDGQITARLAEQQFLDERSSRLHKFDARLAQRALRQDPTAIPAATTLGLQAQLNGELAQARRLFAYAEALSRRDLPTQLWALEDAVTRNDIPGALLHYDIALRTSKRAYDILFPILADALSDSDIRKELVRSLSKRPLWAPLFIEYASANASDPRSTALTFLALSRNGYLVPPLARELLVQRLFAKGLFEDAWSYYTALQPQLTRKASRDSRFGADLANPTIFDWQNKAANGLSASFHPGLLEIAAPSGVGGILVQQVQMLPPGDYQLTGHSITVDQSAESLPYWAVICQNGQELGRVVVPRSSEANGNFTARIAVPATCPAQTLALFARPSDDASGMTGQFDHVQIVPLG